MISAAELARIVETGRLKVKLKQISRQPGRERWRGLCPFHSEKTPSFDIWQAGNKGRYFCQGCGGPPNNKGGDAVDWLRFVEGKTWRELGGVKPDLELQRERQREKQREHLVKIFYDIYPDANPEWQWEIQLLPNQAEKS
jgi:DNA primase